MPFMFSPCRPCCGGSPIADPCPYPFANCEGCCEWAFVWKVVVSGFAGTSGTYGSPATPYTVDFSRFNGTYYLATNQTVLQNSDSDPDNDVQVWNGYCYFGCGSFGSAYTEKFCSAHSMLSCTDNHLNGSCDFGSVGMDSTEYPPSNPSNTYRLVFSALNCDAGWVSPGGCPGGKQIRYSGTLSCETSTVFSFLDFNGGASAVEPTSYPATLTVEPILVALCNPDNCPTSRPYKGFFITWQVTPVGYPVSGTDCGFDADWLCGLSYSQNGYAAQTGACEWTGMTGVDPATSATVNYSWVRITYVGSQFIAKFYIDYASFLAESGEVATYESSTVTEDADTCVDTILMNLDTTSCANIATYIPSFTMAACKR